MTLPTHPSAQDYTLLWDSALDDSGPDVHVPGATVELAPTSMQLFLVGQA